MPEGRPNRYKVTFKDGEYEYVTAWNESEAKRKAIAARYEHEGGTGTRGYQVSNITQPERAPRGGGQVIPRD